MLASAFLHGKLQRAWDPTVLFAVASCLHLLVAAGEARQVVPFSGQASDLQSFVTAEKLPLTMEFSQANADKIFNSGIDRQVGRAWPRSIT